MALIHCQEDIDSGVVNYHNICRDVFIPGPKIKLVKIVLKSVEEAKRRAALIALLTYSIMSGPDIFVKLHTAKQI